MTNIEALVTKARRYCLENHKTWTDRYNSERTGNNFPYTYSKSDYNLFPRYQVLSAILQGIETLVGRDFDNFEDCKGELILIGKNSHTIDTIKSNKELHLLGRRSNLVRLSKRMNRTSKKAIQDERNKFIHFIKTTNQTNISNIEPLPHERKLNDKEANHIRNKLLNIWNYDGDYWEPLESKSPKQTVFIMSDYLTESDKQEIIFEIKKITKDKFFYILTEDLVDYELELSLLNMELYESIICDSSYEWVVYGSFESSIAFGGELLIEKINTIFEHRTELLNKWNGN